MQIMNIEEIEEFDSVVSELPSDFTDQVSDFVITVIPKNRIKSPRNPSKVLNLYLFFWQRWIIVHNNFSCRVY